MLACTPPHIRLGRGPRTATSVVQSSQSQVAGVEAVVKVGLRSAVEAAAGVEVEVEIEVEVEVKSP